MSLPSDTIQAQTLYQATEAHGTVACMVLVHRPTGINVSGYRPKSEERRLREQLEGELEDKVRGRAKA